MNKIIVTDVFGKTPALLTLADAINADMIVDPYDGKSMNFISEEQAYNYFIENIGLNTYVDQLIKTIKQCSVESILIGFSVGASAIWTLSDSKSIQLPITVKRAICFYGSQIRYHTSLLPCFEVELIFPKREPHFDVLALRNILINKAKVTTLQVDFLHGFMNEHSNNFNQTGYEEHVKLLQKIIS